MAVGTAWAVLAAAPVAGEARGSGVTGMQGVPAVTGVEAWAEVRADGGASVRMRYVLRGGPASSDVAAVLLPFGEAVPGDVRVVLDGRPVGEGPAAVGDGGRYEVVLPLKGAAVRGIELRYELASVSSRARGGLRIHVPLFVPELPVADSRPDFFSASLTVPEKWSVSETFPTGFLPAGPSARATGYTLNLSVAPATLSLRAREDGRRRLGLLHLLDALTLLLLGAFAAAGWRHLRGKGS